MAERETIDSSRLFVDDVEESHYKSVYFRVVIAEYSDGRCGHKHYTCQWHAINFVSSNRGRTAKLPSTIQNMPSRIHESAITVPFDSNIYLIGGFDRHGRSISSFCFDTSRPDYGWREIPKMLVGRERPSAVAFNGKLYVFGGARS